MTPQKMEEVTLQQCLINERLVNQQLFAVIIVQHYFQVFFGEILKNQSYVLVCFLHYCWPPSQERQLSPGIKYLYIALYKLLVCQVIWQFILQQFLKQRALIRNITQYVIIFKISISMLQKSIDRILEILGKAVQSKCNLYFNPICQIILMVAKIIIAALIYSRDKTSTDLAHIIIACLHIALYNITQTVRDDSQKLSFIGRCLSLAFDVLGLCFQISDGVNGPIIPISSGELGQEKQCHVGYISFSFHFIITQQEKNAMNDVIKLQDQFSLINMDNFTNLVEKSIFRYYSQHIQLKLTIK